MKNHQKYPDYAKYDWYDWPIMLFSFIGGGISFGLVSNYQYGNMIGNTPLIMKLSEIAYKGFFMFALIFLIALITCVYWRKR